MKPLRVVLAFGLIVPLMLLFIAGINSLQVMDGRWILFLQFIPSSISFLSLAGLLSAGWIAVLAITILTGRIYCSTVCPLGFMMDAVIRIRKWITGSSHSLRNGRGTGAWLHYTVTVAAWVLVASGSLLLISLLDPFTLTGNLFAVFGPQVGSGIGIPFFAITSLVVTLSVFISTWSCGRWFCNHLCPAGGVFRIISRASLFRIGISTPACTGCGDCGRICKAGCIDTELQSLDFSRCVVCFDCIQVCREGAIGFGFWGSLQKMGAKVISVERKERRRFLKVLAAGAGMVLLSPAYRVYGEKVSDHSPVMPPGARDLYHFSDHCTACQLCVQQCPTRVLQPGLLDYGLTGLFQPRMDFTSGFCLADCTVCGNICPTGAIFAMEKEEKRVVQTGIARYVKNLCVVVAEEKACSICAEQCPAGAIRMVDRLQNKIPEISERYCTGCGACEYACPARPERAIYIESNRFHRVALIKQAL